MAEGEAHVLGHSSVYRYSQFERIHLTDLLATACNRAGDQPVGKTGTRLRKKGVEFALHAIGGHTEVHGLVKTPYCRS